MPARIAALVLTLAALHAPFGFARAEAREETIALWARTGGAMRNRTADTELPPAVTAALADVLRQGVRPCECGIRQLRWAWALRHEAESLHPKVVVAFVDPLREPTLGVHYARFALLRFVEGRYHVTSAMAFKRPSLARTDAVLTIRILPRRDADGDGTEDIELAIDERETDKRSCSVARFFAAKPEASLEEIACDRP